MYLPHPSKTFFWIKLQSSTTPILTPKKSTFTFLLSSLPPIQCCRVAENSVSRCVIRSLINIEWREKGIAELLHSFSHNCGFKKQNIHLRDFKDVGFNFTHFANFKFAYFEIEESFGLIWVKLQNGRFHLQISILGT